MLRRTSSTPRQGFTTVEALIAAMVFLLGISGLMGALVQARNSTGQARRYMQATDIANDLAEQIQLWAFNDPRLSSMTGVCVDDPQDKAGALLKPSTDSAYAAYKACMRGDTELTSTLGSSGTTLKWGGLGKPSFTDEQGVRTTYERYYIVRSQNVRPGVMRMQVWVKVRYEDASGVHVVTTQAMRLQMG